MMRLTASPALQHSLQVWVLPLLCGLQAALPASALIQSQYGSLISFPAFVLLWLLGALTFYRGGLGDYWARCPEQSLEITAAVCLELHMPFGLRMPAFIVRLDWVQKALFL